ncbi:MAG: hypothetical protein PHN78_03675, partial [Dehalococcoidales bacterium]|nr:hypothetical protein [Dehalococcoidales bacterium]
LEKRIKEFDKEIIKIKEGRLEISDTPPTLSPLSLGTMNRPGQTMFMPVIQPAYEMINLLLLHFQYQHFCYIEDETGKPAGIEKWVSKLKLDLKVPLSVLEKSLLQACSLEAAFIAQNILLSAEAMGLGAFPTSSYNPLIVMGGTPLTRGLGFRFTTDKKGMLNPVGIDGVIEGFCPPYKSFDEAVDFIANSKFGPGGIYTPEAKPTPFADHASFVSGLDRIPDDVIQCTKDFCNYVYGKYGRFPSRIDTMSMPIWVGVHHIDQDFYKKYYKPEVISKNIREHLADWHS